MTSLNPTVYGAQALASVRAQVGPLFLINRGCQAIVRNAVGSYTITLDSLSAINLQTEAVASLTLAGAAGGFGLITIVSTTSFTVLTFNSAGAATDFDFWVSIFRAAP